MLHERVEDGLLGLDALGVGEEDLMIILEPLLSSKTLGPEEDEVAQEDKETEDNAGGDSQLEAFLVLSVLLLRVAELHSNSVCFSIEDSVEWEGGQRTLAKSNVLSAVG